MRISDWSSDVCSSDLANWHGTSWPAFQTGEVEADVPAPQALSLPSRQALWRSVWASWSGCADASPSPMIVPSVSHASAQPWSHAWANSYTDRFRYTGSASLRE